MSVTPLPPTTHHTLLLFGPAQSFIELDNVVKLIAGVTNMIGIPHFLRVKDMTRSIDAILWHRSMSAEDTHLNTWIAPVACLLAPKREGSEGVLNFLHHNSLIR